MNTFTTCSLPIGFQYRKNISNARSHLGQDDCGAVSNKNMKKRSCRIIPQLHISQDEEMQAASSPWQANVFAGGTTPSTQSGPKILRGKNPKPLPWTHRLFSHQCIQTHTAEMARNIPKLSYLYHSHNSFGQANPPSQTIPSTSSSSVMGKGVSE